MRKDFINGCNFCGEDFKGESHKCNFCGKVHCRNHKLPEDHKCNALIQRNQKSSPIEVSVQQAATLAAVFTPLQVEAERKSYQPQAQVDSNQNRETYLAQTSPPSEYSAKTSQDLYKSAVPQNSPERKSERHSEKTRDSGSKDGREEESEDTNLKKKHQRRNR